MSNETPRKRSRKRRSSGRRRLSMKKSAVAARRRRRASEAAETSHKPRRRKRRSSRRRRAAAEAPRKRRSSRRRSGRRHSVRGHRVKRHMSREAPRRRKRRSSKRRRSSGRRRTSRRSTGRRSYRSRRGYALENPMTATEMAVGAVTGVLGFIAADALDRVIATHALADKGAVGSDGKELWMDNADGTRYPGLFNATAVLAPMDWQRWLAGAGITAVPFIVAAMIKSPMGRSSLQFFGFGAGIRILGKAATDLMAKLTSRMSWGARLYDGEARAAALSAGAGAEANLPFSGLGAIGVGTAGCGCANCVTGVGACCNRGMFAPTGAPVVAPVVANPIAPQPVVAPPAVVPQPAAPPALVMPPSVFSPPPPPPPVGRTYTQVPLAPGANTGRPFTPPPFVRKPVTNAVAGFPSGVAGTPVRSRYRWGTDQEQQTD
jgi:hypothetical protein